MATPPDFTAGTALAADSLNKVGLWLIKKQTIGTAVTSVAVTNVFSADYENYRIIISGGVGSASTSLGIQLGASTTSYYHNLTYAAWTAAGVTILGANPGTSWLYAGCTDVNANVMNVDVIAPNLAKHTRISGWYVRTDLAGYFTGTHQVATAYTDFTVSVDGGHNITGGTIYVYGYNNG